jgi:hypothetical protein
MARPEVVLTTGQHQGLRRSGFGCCIDCGHNQSPSRRSRILGFTKRREHLSLVTTARRWISAGSAQREQRGDDCSGASSEDQVELLVQGFPPGKSFELVQNPERVEALRAPTVEAQAPPSSCRRIPRSPCGPAQH